MVHSVGPLNNVPFFKGISNFSQFPVVKSPALKVGPFWHVFVNPVWKFCFCSGMNFTPEFQSLTLTFPNNYYVIKF